MLNTPLAARIIVSQAEAAHAAPAHEIPLIFYLFATASIGYLTFNLRKLTAVKIGTSYEGNYAPATQLFQALFFGVAQRKVFRHILPAVTRAHSSLRARAHAKWPPAPLQGQNCRQHLPPRGSLAPHRAEA